MEGGNKFIFFCLLICCFTPLSAYSVNSKDTVKMGGVLEEAVITSEIDNIRPSFVISKLNPIFLHTIPSVFGNNDVMKIIQYMPGVNSASEGDVGISIRGGNHDETLILLDKIPIFNPGNLKGFVSVFNPDVVGDTYVYKSGFPSKYGGKLSGIVDVIGKYGENNGVHGNISIGPIISSLSLKGLIKENTHYLMSGRLSYLGLLVLPIYRKLNSNTTYVKPFEDMDYYDVNAIIMHRFSNKNSLKGSFYYGDNSTKMNNKTSVESQFFHGENISRWGNMGGSIQWNCVPNNNHRINSYIYYSQFRKNDLIYQRNVYVNEIDTISKRILESMNSKVLGIQDVALGMDAEYLQGFHNIEYGFKYSFQIGGSIFNNSSYEKELFNSVENVLFENMSSYTSRDYLHTVSIYAEDEMSLWDRVNIGMGCRLVLYNNRAEFALVPEPRTRLSLYPFSNKKLSFKFSYSRMSQAVHQLTSGSVVREFDDWVLMNEEIPVSISNNYSGGVFIDLYPFNKKMSMSLECYYNQSKGIIDYKNGASYIELENIADIIDVGKGKSYGLEFAINKDVGTTVWNLSYTWSKSLNKFDYINRGEWLYSKQDRRHKLSAVFCQKLGKYIDVSASFMYMTGKKITLENMVVPVALKYLGDMFDSEYLLSVADRKNNYKLKDYHKLDLSINYYIFHKVGKSRINLSINNVYNHHNTYKLWLYKLRENQGYSLKSICLFPFMPSLSYSFEF